MFGLGLSEMIFIAILALVVIGPQKLPTFLQAAGRGFAEFRKALDDIQKSVYESAHPQDQSSYIDQLMKEREEYRAKFEAADAKNKEAAEEPAQDGPAEATAVQTAEEAVAPQPDSAPDEQDPFDAYLEIAQGDSALPAGESPVDGSGELVAQAEERAQAPAPEGGARK